MLEKSDPIIPDWTRQRIANEHQSNPMFHSAMTISELAFRAGLNPATLGTTVNDYNQSIALGSADAHNRVFRPSRLAKPPFYSIAMQGWTLVSFAGLSIDARLQVLDREARPIQNLYAIGEVIGAGATSGAAYTNGMLVTPAITFGKLLGQRLAAG
jgi:hypothetical protein